MSIEDEARSYINRKHPEWHDNGVGIVQGSHYRAGFVAGAVWQASRKVEAATDEREALIERVLKVTDDMRSGGWHSGKTVAEMGQKIYDILTESTNGYVA